MEIRGQDLCPFCRAEPMSPADELARLEHWAAKDSAAAVCQLGSCYRRGDLGLEIDSPRAVALYERAVELAPGTDDHAAALSVFATFRTKRGLRFRADETDALAQYVTQRQNERRTAAE